MALSGSNTVAVGSYWRLVLEWSATQSIANNSSTVTARLYWQATSSTAGISSSATKSGYIIIDGIRYNFSGAGLASLRGNQKKLLHTAKKVVAHNSNGSKSISISGNFGMAVTLSGTYYDSRTVSLTANLDTIPRQSSVSSVSNFTLPGGAPTFTIASHVSSFRHVADLLYNGETIATLSNLAGGTHTFNLTTAQQNTLLDRLKNTTSGSYQIHITTWSGSTRVGSSSTRNGTVNVSASVVPTITSVNILEAVSELDAKFGAFVQDKSKLSLSMTAAGVHGSTIKSYRIIANGQTYTSRTATTSELISSGTQTITFEAIDSRGRKARNTRNIAVVSYRNPSINVFTAERDESDESVVNVQVQATISPIHNKNDKLFRVKYSTKNGTTLTHVLPSTNYALNSTASIPNVDPDSEYTFVLEVVDFFTKSEFTRNIGTAFTLMNFHKSGKGIAFGEVMQDEEGFHVNLPAWFRGNTTIDQLFLNALKGVHWGVSASVAMDKEEGGDLVFDPFILGKGYRFITGANGRFTIEGLSSLFNISYPTGGHAYIAYHEGDVRRAYVGFPNDNSSNFVINNAKVNGEIMIGGDAQGGFLRSKVAYDRTYSNPSNLCVTTYGTIGRATSARKYKLLEEEVPVEKLVPLLNIKPKTWYDKSACEHHAQYLEAKENGEDVSEWDVPETERHFGAIADDFAELGLDEFVIYKRNADGTKEIEGLAYDRVGVALLPIVKNLFDKVKTLEDEIQLLKKGDDV